jgi:hypothetical protein
MNKIHFVFAAFVIFLFPLTVRATVVGNWAICDSCESEADFMTAAITWHGGKTTKVRVSVGNPNTGEVYTMWVGGTDVLNDPLSLRKQISDYAHTSQMQVIYTEPTTTTIKCLSAN